MASPRTLVDGPAPRRRYFEVVLATGENAAVFLDEESGRWYRQRA